MANADRVTNAPHGPIRSVTDHAPHAIIPPEQIFLGGIMDGTATTALIAGITGLMGLFFGRQFWGMASGLVANQREEITRLQAIVEKLRDRIDRIEDDLHGKDLELLETQSQLDNFVTSNQYLTNENDRLRKRVSALSLEVSEVRNQNDILREVIASLDPDMAIEID